MVSRTAGSLCGCSGSDDTLEASLQARLNFSTNLARRTLVFGGLFGLTGLSSGCDRAFAHSPESQHSPLPFSFSGTPQQSDLVIGTTVPGAQIDASGITTNADSDGRFVMGFDRDAPSQALITISLGATIARFGLDVAPRAYPVTSVSGLPSATIDPPAEALARIEADAALKRQAFDSNNPIARGFEEAFRWPLDDVRITSPWGATRMLNGKSQRPHFGIDLGAPRGTPIYAPASGFVVLAEPDMHFEGGMVAIDHGQGLITTYLHQSALAVEVGQRVTPGTLIGYVGSKGRATGPHLCWRMRWRGRNLDPSLRVRSA